MPITVFPLAYRLAGRPMTDDRSGRFASTVAIGITIAAELFSLLIA
ncbi:hypothetical protein [Algoriphagus antarcticus]|nr:hypothetical protein [Algoriphagus antarcticus]